MCRGYKALFTVWIITRHNFGSVEYIISTWFAVVLRCTSYILCFLLYSKLVIFSTKCTRSKIKYSHNHRKNEVHEHRCRLSLQTVFTRLILFWGISYISRYLSFKSVNERLKQSTTILKGNKFFSSFGFNHLQKSLVFI